uniref:hypothetical protein n=1 Tax=Alistipes putredinis TaxID=28117 RepID=UPI00349F39BC
SFTNRCNSNVGFQIKPGAFCSGLFVFQLITLFTDTFVPCAEMAAAVQKRKDPYNLFVTVEKYIAVRCMQ